MFNSSISQHIKDFIVTRHCEVFYVLELQPASWADGTFLNDVISVSISSHIQLPLKKCLLGKKSVHVINAISESEVYSLLLKKQN